MAKEDKGKVKMTVIHFETESDNATLQENIRAIANTLTRALAPPPRIVPQQLTSGNGAATNGAGAAHAPEADDFEDAIDAEIVSDSKKPKAKKAAASKGRSPVALDLDLTVGDVPLKQFMEQKKPNSDNKRYLVIAQWLKTNLNLEEVTMDHIYTGYRHMGWNVPDDAGGPLRQCKQQGWMKRGKGKGAYAINHIGEGVVNDIGQAEQSA